MYIYIYTIYTHKQEKPYIYRVFPPGVNGGRVSPLPAKNLLISTDLEKFAPSRPPPLHHNHQIFISPTTKQQFSSYNPIKTAFLAVVIALAPFLF